MSTTEKVPPEVLIKLRVELDAVVATGEWYVDNWTVEQQIMAMLQGWAVCVTSIQADAGRIRLHGVFTRPFADEQHMLEFIKQRADKGSELHQQALLNHIAYKLRHA